MERNNVVLVDENDNAIAEMEKLVAHQRGCLHRAFSVFIFNPSHYTVWFKHAFPELLSKINP